MPSLVELLKNNNSFKYGTDYNTVESDKQTLSDFEEDGLRPNFGNLQADLYGIDTLRITKQSTAILDDMRSNTGGDQGLLGGITNFANKVGNQFASTLGIPVLQIPTRVTEDNRLALAIKGNGNDNIISALAKIRKKQEGNILGKFLQQTADGTPSQVGRRAVGTARSMAKNAAKNLLLGSGEVGVNSPISQTLSLSGESIRYGSENTYSSNLKSPDGELGLLKILTDIQDQSPDYSDFVLQASLQDTISRPDPSFGTDNGSTSDTDNERFPRLPEFSISAITQNLPNRPERKYSDKDDIKRFNIDSSEIGKFQSKSDPINKSITYTSQDESGTPDSPLVDDKTYDDLDFIPLRFYSVFKKEGVAFKATISGLSETTSPSWSENKFLGNPFTTYTYDGVSRAITFNFKVYSLNVEEHIACWERLNFLTSLTYPQNQSLRIYTTPPILRLTLGNLYTNKIGFIESLSYTIDDNVPWEIGYTVESDREEINSKLKSKNSIRITKLDKTGTLGIENYKLPSIVDVSVGFKFIESASETVGKKLYSFGKPITN